MSSHCHEVILSGTGGHCKADISGHTAAHTMAREVTSCQGGAGICVSGENGYKLARCVTRAFRTAFYCSLTGIDWVPHEYPLVAEQQECIYFSLFLFQLNVKNMEAKCSSINLTADKDIQLSLPNQENLPVLQPVACPMPELRIAQPPSSGLFYYAGFTYWHDKDHPSPDSQLYTQGPFARTGS